MRTHSGSKKAGESGSLYRLIYCSHNVIAPFIPTVGVQTVVHAILSVARERNKAENVTGALLFTGAGFAQVLEGPREVVERTFERINGDPRHTHVTVLSFTPTERRSFPDWPMGFSGQASVEGTDPLEGLLADVSYAGPRATTGSDVLRLLEKLVQREEDWVPV
jgi:hypothetical protein